MGVLQSSTSIINKTHKAREPGENCLSRVAETDLTGEVCLPQAEPGDGQEVGGGGGDGGWSQGVAPHLLPPAPGGSQEPLLAQLTVAAATTTVQEVLQVEIAGGDQVGGGGVESRELHHRIRVFLEFPAGHGGSESLSVLDAHDVVEEGVEGGGEIVETAGGVEEDLVDCAEHFQLLEVNIAQPLEVERSPGDKEEDHNRN